MGAPDGGGRRAGGIDGEMRSACNAAHVCVWPQVGAACTDVYKGVPFSVPKGVHVVATQSRGQAAT
eukprot:7009491-Prorocentrum_lima.AAC.1